MFLLSESSDCPEDRWPMRLFSSIESAVKYLSKLHSVVNECKVDLDIKILNTHTQYDTNAIRVVIQEKYPFYQKYEYFL